MSRTFHLEDTLGEGAFGVVHLARVTDEEGFVQRLAVKMLHAHYSADADLVGRLRDEARLLALLQHEHIVRVHGLSRIDGRLAILMEPIPGADLSAAQGQAIPPRAALQVTEAVASALCAAWETVPPGHDEPLRAVHRDIKPSNIMVTERGGVKVMDFGVARARFDHREAQTRSQQFGTARFMAPERWLEGEAGAPSDVFSLGITLVELVTGAAVPRPRLSRASFCEDIDAIVAVLPNEGLRELIRGMCAFAPDERFTAEQVVLRCRELEAAVEGPGLRRWAETWVAAHRFKGGTDAPVALTEDVSGETFGVAPTTTVAVAEAAPPPRRAVAWVFGSVAAATMVASGLWVWTQAPLDTPATATGAVPPPVAADPAPPPAPASEVPAQAPVPDAVPTADEVVEVDAVERPVEVAPVAARPRPVRASAVPAAPVEQPVAVAPEPAVAASVVTFALQPASLTARTAQGPVRHYTALELPHGIHPVDVDGEQGTWRCTVRVDAAPATWRIDDRSQSCLRIQ